MEYKIFGCKTNKYFTDKWAESPLLTGKKGIFVSSCVVTDKAKSKWVRFVNKKLKTLKEGEKIFLSGCGSLKDGDIDTDFYSIYPELIPFRDKIDLLPEDPEDIPGYVAPAKLDLKSRLAQAKLVGTGLHTKKFIVIQTGCDNFCTFCLTVQARGRHKSRSSEDIIQEIQDFVDEGGKEVVLTGTNLGAWGALSSEDIADTKFPELVQEILDKTTLPRLRISSLGVEFVSDRLIELFKKTRINPYIHLSIQSGSDSILRAMNRHYGRKQLLDTMKKLRALEREDGVMLNIGADLIVGFPGETDSDYEDTVGIVRDFQVTQLHAFPFSAHTDHYSVPAGKFPNQIDERVKTLRWTDLMSAGEKATDDFHRANDGKKFKVLVEGKGTGWTENYIECTPLNFEPISGALFEKKTIIEGVYRYGR